MSIFENYPAERYRELFEIVMSDRCWECDKVKAEGKCPDCDDPGEWCGECLRRHQELVHSEAEL